jgi:hypothetical protein
MEPLLLVRPELMMQYELRIAREHFRVEESRTACKDSLVIGRYSTLPYYRELERDLEVNGCQLINNLAEHTWIAEFRYYMALKEYTPESWDEDNFHLCAHGGPFVVKGKLSSKKRQWSTQMFARTRKQALAIAARLKQDTWIGDQGIIFRRYVPLRTFGRSKYGLPFTNEWRFFYFLETRLSYGCYWSMAECPCDATMTAAGLHLADEVARIAARHATFFVLDIAETATGNWILIEVNDAQMAGLSENDPGVFYASLRAALGSGNRPS